MVLRRKLRQSKWRKVHLPSLQMEASDVPCSVPTKYRHVFTTQGTHMFKGKGYLTLDTQTWVHRPWVHRPEQSEAQGHSRCPGLVSSSMTLSGVPRDSVQARGTLAKGVSHPAFPLPPTTHSVGCDCG